MSYCTQKSVLTNVQSNSFVKLELCKHPWK